MSRPSVQDASSNLAVSTTALAITRTLPPSPGQVDGPRREAERVTQLAAELHDHFAQSLWCLDLELAAVERLLECDQAAARDHLGVARSRLDDAYREVRLIIGTLRASPGAEPSFVQSVETRLRIFGERTGLAWQLDVHDDLAELSQLAEIHLLAILDQALQNVRQHAAATRVTVKITVGQCDVLFEVSDNGRGASPNVLERSAHEGHYGLAIMQERARYLDGSIEIASTIGHGTTVGVRVPRAAIQRRRRAFARGITGGARGRKATSSR